MKGSWIIALAALLAVMATARLGWWQLDRAAQKQALQQSIEDRGREPPLQAMQLARDESEARAQHHRLVQLSGHWSTNPAHTVFLDNRPMNGRAGFFVLTPLLLSDGSAVLVQRGWQPRDLRDRTITQPLQTPVGLVRLKGRIAPPPARLLEFEGAEQGAIRQNLDVSSFAIETRLTLRPLSVLQLSPAELCADTADSADTPANTDCPPQADQLARDWPQPSTGIDKHYGYAFQWFSLSALVAGLCLWFQVIRPRRARAAHSA